MQTYKSAKCGGHSICKIYKETDIPKKELVDKKCIMCGGELKEYRPMYYSYEFSQHRFPKEIKLTFHYLTGRYWKHTPYRIKARIRIIRGFFPKLYMRNGPTYYFCYECGQVYASAPSYNFRNWPIRKRI